MEVRNATGYLASRIVFYLMNLHTQRRTLYFARAGRSMNATYKADSPLSKEGWEYATLLKDRLMGFREEEYKRELEQGEKLRSLTVRTPPPPFSFYRYPPPFPCRFFCFFCQDACHALLIVSFPQILAHSAYPRPFFPFYYDL